MLGGLPGRGAEGVCCAGPTQEGGQGWGLLPGEGGEPGEKGDVKTKEQKGP